MWQLIEQKLKVKRYREYTVSSLSVRVNKSHLCKHFFFFFMQTFLNSLLFTFLNFNSILECCAFKGILDKVKFLGLPRKFEGKMTGGLYYIRCLQSTYTVKHENKAPTSLFFTIVFGMTFCFNYSFNCLLLVYSILNEHWSTEKYWKDLENIEILIWKNFQDWKILERSYKCVGSLHAITERSLKYWLRTLHYQPIQGWIFLLL